MHTILIPKEELVSFEKLFRGCIKVKTLSPYEHARYKCDKSTVIVYKSGKVVFSEVTTNLREDILDFFVSLDDYDGPVIGSDEAGKGEVLGPIVVGAVLLSTKKQRAEARFEGVMDSKEISGRQLARLYSHVSKYTHSTRMLTPQDFNELFKNNLNEILCNMHVSALEPLVKSVNGPCRVIIDKFGGKAQDSYLRDQIYELNPDAEVRIITNAERFIPVACGSILAKYEYEKWIDAYNERMKYDIRKISLKDIKPEYKKFCKLAYIKN